MLKRLSPSPSTRKSWFQISLVLLITLSIVFIVAFIENEQKKIKPQRISQSLKEIKIDKLNSSNSSNSGLTKTNNFEAEKNSNNKCEYKINLSTIVCLTSDLKLLAQIQNMAVISAALLFFFDTFDRKKQLERQAWQLIDGAQGSETSGARKQAIEDLYKEGADITGLDADGADLRGINLSGANLERASFKNAILEKANFEEAYLREANFTGANVKGANFKKASLWGANFTRADLRAWYDKDKDDDKNTDFRDADLGFTTFNRAKVDDAVFGVIDEEPQLGQETKLKGAKFRGVNLNNVNLNKVSIAEAKLGGAIIEDIEIIRKAEEYKEACYSKDFQDTHHDEIKKVDTEYSEDPEFQQITTQKIVEISQRLLSKKSLSLQDEESLCDFVNLLNHLVILFKESNNECLTDNELSDKVIDLKKALEGKQQYDEKGLKKSLINQKLIEETEKLLAEKRKNRNIEE